MQLMGGGDPGGAGRGGFMIPHQQGMYVQDPFHPQQQQVHYAQPFVEGGGGMVPIQTGVILPQNFNNNQFVASASSSSSAAAAAGGGGGGDSDGPSGNEFVRVKPSNGGLSGYQDEYAHPHQLANVPVVVAKPLPLGNF